MYYVSVRNIINVLMILITPVPGNAYIMLRTLKDTGCTSLKTPLAASNVYVPVPPPVTYGHSMPASLNACKIKF